MTLVVNNAVSTGNVLVEIKYNPTKEDPNKAVITMTEKEDIDNDLEKGKLLFTATGTLIEGANNIFDLIATENGKETETKVTGTFNKGVLAIVVTSTPK